MFSRKDVRRIMIARCRLRDPVEEAVDMSYAQRLVSRILEDERPRGNRLADMKVYRDEPILRTGA